MTRGTYWRCAACGFACDKDNVCPDCGYHTLVQEDFPERTWVHATEWRGLTDEERIELMESTHPKNRWTILELCEAKLRKLNEAQQRKPQFKEFIKWAGAQGYDCAQTCNSDTGEWIVLNPMTADLWKAWQAAHGITSKGLQGESNE